MFFSKSGSSTAECPRHNRRILKSIFCSYSLEVYPYGDRNSVGSIRLLVGRCKRICSVKCVIYFSTIERSFAVHSAACKIDCRRTGYRIGNLISFRIFKTRCRNAKIYLAALIHVSRAVTFYNNTRGIKDCSIGVYYIESPVSRSYIRNSLLSAGDFSCF